MPNTPGRFGGAKIQPVGAGRLKSQDPTPSGAGKRTGALLSELERVKLEGDPLYLYGSGTFLETVSGAVPEVPPVTSIGDRLTFFEKTGTNPYKVGIGVDGDRTLWFQATGAVASNDEDGGFDWYCDGSSTGAMARRMRLSGTGRLLLSTGLPVTHARITSAGPISTPVETVSGGGSLSLAATSSLVVGDATGGTCTVNLPAAADATGIPYTIKRVNAGVNTIIVDGNGVETIDGAATKTLGSQYACIRVQSDGSAWHITASMGTVT